VSFQAKNNLFKNLQVNFKKDAAFFRSGLPGVTHSKYSDPIKLVKSILVGSIYKTTKTIYKTPGLLVFKSKLTILCCFKFMFYLFERPLINRTLFYN